MDNLHENTNNSMSGRLDFQAPDAKVLVVDDNAVNILIATNLLKKFKIAAESVQSGAEAVRLAKTKIYDVIFMDHLMPEMDGVETLKAIKELPSPNSDCKVIALSANLSDDIALMFENAGAFGMLNKPILIDELASNLLRSLPEEKIIRKASEGTANTGNGNTADISTANTGVIYERPEDVLEYSTAQYSTSDKDEKENIYNSENSLQEEIYTDAGSEANISNIRRCLESIEGIDYELGLKYSAGSGENYMMIARTACASIEKYLTDVKNYSAISDFSVIKRAFHSLKSMYMTLGFKDISALAKKLEQASDENQAVFIYQNIEEFIIQSDKLLDNLISAVKTYDNISGSTLDNTEKDEDVFENEDILFHIDEIKTSLEYCEIYAITENLKTLSKHTPKSMRPDFLKAIEAAGMFDYDMISEIVNKISAQLG